MDRNRQTAFKDMSSMPMKRACSSLWVPNMQIPLVGIHRCLPSFILVHGFTQVPSTPSQAEVGDAGSHALNTLAEHIAGMYLPSGWYFQ